MSSENRFLIPGDYSLSSHWLAWHRSLGTRAPVIFLLSGWLGCETWQIHTLPRGSLWLAQLLGLAGVSGPANVGFLPSLQVCAEWEERGQWQHRSESQHLRERAGIWIQGRGKEAMMVERRDPKSHEMSTVLGASRVSFPLVPPWGRYWYCTWSPYPSSDLK